MGKPNEWEIFIGGHKVTKRSVADGGQQAQEEDQNQTEAAKRERDRLAREAEEKAWKEAQIKAQEKARAEREAYHQKMINLAEAVDLDGIMAELDYVLSEPDERFYQAMGWIHYGLQVAASKAPQRLYAFLGARKAAFEGFLLIRSQIMAMNAIRNHDAKAGPPYYGQLPREVVEVLIPRLETIGRAVLETATTFARVERSMKMTSGKKAGRKTGACYGHDQHSEQPRKSNRRSSQRERAAEVPEHPTIPAGDAGGAEAVPGATGIPSKAA